MPGYIRPPVTKHTELTDKEVAGVIDHADASVTDPKLASGPPTKEIQVNFFHANQPANQPVVPVNLDFGMQAFAIFKLPHDYHSMLVFNIYVEPNMDKADFSFRLSLYAAACGEDIPTHGGAADTTSKLIAGIYNCVDVEAKLPAVVAQLEAGDVLTVEILNKEADNLLTAYLVNVRYE